MSRFDIDYSKLEQGLTKRVKLADVKDRIEKVAFDIVRFKDSDLDHLWQIQSCNDGDYIVALYDEEQDNIKTASCKWDVVANDTTKNLSIFYAGEPIVRIAYDTLNLPQEDYPLVKKTLKNKLAENKKLVASLLGEMHPSARLKVLAKYPELA